MIFTPTTLPGSFLIDITLIKDDRGWFARTYCKDQFLQIGHHKEWVQLNHSYTNKKGTIRGMHYQQDRYKEVKLIRCIAGVVYDVIIDLRKDSKTFLKWFGAQLSAENKKMMYIPEGFAHGFQALADNSELIYHHSEVYTPVAEGGIRFNEPAINIQWPLAITEFSERDANHPLLNKNFKGI